MKPYYADLLGWQEFMTPPEPRSTGESRRAFAERLVGWSTNYAIQLVTTHRDQATIYGPYHLPNLE